MQKFLSMITGNSEMKGFLQKFTQSFLNARKHFYPDSSSQYGSTQNIYLDYLISPDFWKKRVHSYFWYNTVLFRMMRNHIRLFPFRQVYTRRSCICNKSFTHTQTNRPNSSFRKSYVSRLLQYTFHFYSDFNSRSK